MAIRIMAAAGLAAASMVSVAPAFADTGSVKAWESLRVNRMGTHCADDKNCFNRMHPAIPAVMTAKPGPAAAVPETFCT